MSLAEDVATFVKKAPLAWAVTILSVGFVLYSTATRDYVTREEFNKWSSAHERGRHATSASVDDVRSMSKLTEVVAGLVKSVERNTAQLTEVHKDIRSILLRDK